MMRQLFFSVLLVAVGIMNTNSPILYTRLSDTSPYFTEEYKYADITLRQGRVFTNVKTRIDLAAQGTYFISENRIEIYLEAGAVKQIILRDTTDNGIVVYKFQTGFPAADRQTPNYFYIVMSEGKCSFLKLISKQETEKKNDVNGASIKEYETYEGYYLFSKGIMKRWKKDKETLLAALSDKTEQVNQFVQSNKINLKSPEQVVKLLNYYNSL